jgi:dihydrofolate synthase/folylpolyglutamate synthase
VNFLEYLNAKPLYYDEIDYTRMPRIYKKIKESLVTPKIIHVIGTNAKGTTGRFLANALHAKGLSVGHYSSPHILKFNERVWVDGANATDVELEEAHRELQKILTIEDAASLSYFEYTTLLSMIIFKECEYVVMEAGLGGEHDATAVFDKVLTLVTPIAYDHEALLGSSIEQIATTKLNAIQNSAIIATQTYPQVYSIAEQIASQKGLNIYMVNDFIKELDREKINHIANTLSLIPYLRDNLTLSIAALKFLKIEYETYDFKNPPLFGRVSKISKNITVDVGHNVLAAQGILKALHGDKYILVYNSYKDKIYKEILSILKPIILHVEIITIDEQRIVSIESIKSTLKNLKIKYKTFKETKPEYKYLVFGSFSVVERFLREYHE